MARKAAEVHRGADQPARGLRPVASAAGRNVPTGNLRDTTLSLAKGGELFRLNCASCHGTTGKGAPLSAGKMAPDAQRRPPTAQIYTAMLTGPENMPVFSDNQLTPTQKQAIIAYIQTLKASKDPGGSGIDRIGPVSEAIVIWVAGVGADRHDHHVDRSEVATEPTVDARRCPPRARRPAMHRGRQLRDHSTTNVPGPTSCAR